MIFMGFPLGYSKFFKYNLQTIDTWSFSKQCHLLFNTKLPTLNKLKNHYESIAQQYRFKVNQSTLFVLKNWVLDNILIVFFRMTMFYFVVIYLHFDILLIVPYGFASFNSIEPLGFLEQFTCKWINFFIGFYIVLSFIQNNSIYSIDCKNLMPEYKI